jgi:hypothetical protein
MLRSVAGKLTTRGRLRSAYALALALVCVAAGCVPMVAPEGTGCPRSSGLNLATYEWRDAVWRGRPATLLSSLASARRVCLTAVLVDVTRVATYDPVAGRAALASYAGELRALTAAAGRSGVAVEAVAGDPNWAVANELHVRRVLDFVGGFNRATAPGARLRGLQFDVEPWSLPRFQTAPQSTLGGYLDMVAGVVAVQRRTAGTPRVGFAIPYWFEGTNPKTVIDYAGRHAPALDHLARLLRVSPAAAVSVMAHVARISGPGGITTVAKRAIDRLHGLAPAVRATVGVETTNSDPETPSYYGRSADVFVADMQTLSRAFMATPAFDGIVVDDRAGVLRIVGTAG